MRRTLVWLAALLMPIGAALAQGTGAITGIVRQTEGAPIPAVSVTIVGTRIGTITHDDGRYTISGVAPGTYRVRATRIGYAPQEVTATVGSGVAGTADFQLKPIAISLEQTVVIGYGTSRRSDLTGAVSSVTPDVARTPISSLEQTLQGSAPGVQVTTASSAPGGGISIRIRGGSSVNGNNEPLYVVDGFPIENDPAANGDPSDGGRVNTAPANPLAALNPGDIASIEILKDASATSIYGARGANGVIIITTKGGQAGKPAVTLDSYTGIQNVAKRYDLLNATQFAEFANEYAARQNLPAPYADPASLGVGTDWQSVIFRQAPINNLQAAVSGGSSGANPTRYALSSGVFRQVGVVLGSDFRRLSLRGNVDQTVGKRLHVSSNVLLSQVNSSQVPTDGTFNSGAGAVGAALQYIPVMPVRKPDGTYSLLQTDFPAALAALGAGPASVPNPLSMAQDVNDKLADLRMLANIFGEVTLFPGLRLKSSVGADVSNRTRDTYYPRTTLMGANFNGRAIRGRNGNTSFLNENTLNYDKTVGSHQISVLGGFTRQTQNATKSTESNSNFVSDITGFQNIGAGSQSGGPTVTSGHTRWTLASYLGRVNYTLLNRYLFTVTGREDGSSRFGVNHRWGFFPSFAFGWKLSDEPFMRKFSALDQLKLRGSWGKAGNPSIQPYQSVTRLTAQQYTFNGVIAPGYYPSSLGNDNLGWESTKQSDAGLDLSMWNGRMEFSADYYNKRTDDLLLGIDLPAESGYASALVNAGSIQNKGVELSLTVRPFTGAKGGFSWTSTFNFARNRNKVLDLGGVNRIFASQSIAPDLGTAGTVVQVGQPLGAFFGYKTDGIFRDSAAVADYTKTTRLASGTISPGQVRIVDVNGDGVIDANDRTIIGNPNPKWTGGWQNTISIKGFELSSSVDATVGNDVLNLNLYRMYGASPGTNIALSRWLDHWTVDNPDAKFPRVNSTPVAIGADFTTSVLEDGSFVRLRTVTIAHQLPSFLRLGNVDGGRVFVTGQNLKTWTNYTGFNPDVSSQGVGNVNRGIDLGSYPIARTFIFGLNLNY